MPLPVELPESKNKPPALRSVPDPALPPATVKAFPALELVARGFIDALAALPRVISPPDTAISPTKVAFLVS